MNRRTDDQQPAEPRPMGVSIGSQVFASIDAAQVWLAREARAHRERCALRYQQILAGGTSQ